MKVAGTILAVLAISGTIIVTLAEDHMYTTKYDSIDVDAVINNDRLLNNYVGCLMDENSCTADAAELKKNLPDALATDCASCSEKQKMIADKVSHHLIDHRPDDWKRLEEVYDPTGSYRERYLSGKDEDPVETSTN